MIQPVKNFWHAFGGERPTWQLCRVFTAVNGTQWRAFYDTGADRKMWEFLYPEDSVDYKIQVQKA